jgi:hypothetical protein
MVKTKYKELKIMSRNQFLMSASISTNYGVMVSMLKLSMVESEFKP